MTTNAMRINEIEARVTQLNQAIQGTNVASDEVSEDGANNLLFGVE